MTFRVRSFEQATDLPLLTRAVEGIQAHLVALDDRGMERLEPDFGELATRDTLRLLRRQQNKVLIATTEGGQFIGLIVGLLDDRSGTDLLSLDETRAGWVSDLWVEPEYRGQGVGKLLIETIEAWFKESGCQHAWLSVNHCNTDATTFYTQGGYSPYEITMYKPL